VKDCHRYLEALHLTHPSGVQRSSDSRGDCLIVYPPVNV